MVSAPRQICDNLHYFIPSPFPRQPGNSFHPSHLSHSFFAPSMPRSFCFILILLHLLPVRPPLSPSRFPLHLPLPTHTHNNNRRAGVLFGPDHEVRSGTPGGRRGQLRHRGQPTTGQQRSRTEGGREGGNGFLTSLVSFSCIRNICSLSRGTFSCFGFVFSSSCRL